MAVREEIVDIKSDSARHVVNHSQNEKSLASSSEVCMDLQGLSARWHQNGRSNRSSFALPKPSETPEAKIEVKSPLRPKLSVQLAI